VKVWVDYADRPDFPGYELLEGGRFVVDIEDDGYIVQDADSYEGNDWDEVLAFVAARVSSQKTIYVTDGVLGFDHDGFFITDPFTSECGRFDVDPLAYYGLTAEQVEQFKGEMN